MDYASNLHVYIKAGSYAVMHSIFAVEFVEIIVEQVNRKVAMIFNAVSSRWEHCFKFSLRIRTN